MFLKSIFDNSGSRTVPIAIANIPIGSWINLSEIYNQVGLPVSSKEAKIVSTKIFICIIPPAKIAGSITTRTFLTPGWEKFKRGIGILSIAARGAPLAAIDRIPIPRLNFSHPGVRKVLVVMLPAIFAGGIMQINILVDTIFASLLETGSPTWLYISDRLIQLPMGIFAIAIGTVLLPLLSKIDFKNNKIQFIDNVRKSQRLVLLIGLPSCIGIYFCSEAIIAAIFYRGEFTYIDVIKTSLSLMKF